MQVRQSIDYFFNEDFLTKNAFGMPAEKPTFALLKKGFKHLGRG
jgi:hypothetical protein